MGVLSEITLSVVFPFNMVPVTLSPRLLPVITRPGAATAATLIPYFWLPTMSRTPPILAPTIETGQVPICV